jgi:hypothetical protein
VLTGAVTWAEQHPPESIHGVETWSRLAGLGGETGVASAGEGAPLVAEFCVAELAAALGVSTDSGRVLMSHGLELRYRLPKLHARVMTGAVPPTQDPRTRLGLHRHRTRHLPVDQPARLPVPAQPSRNFGRQPRPAVAT